MLRFDISVIIVVVGLLYFTFLIKYIYILPTAVVLGILVVGSTCMDPVTDYFNVPSCALRLVYQMVWCVLSCITWGNANEKIN